MIKPIYSTVFIILCLGLMACSPVETDTQTLPQTSDPKVNTMTENTQTDASQPDIILPDTPDVSAIMHNLINLIDSLHSRADFNPQHVSQVAQITLQKDTTSKNEGYEYNLQITPSWGMTYNLWPKSLTGDYSRLSFRFGQQHPHKKPPMTDICLVDVEAFHKSLLQQGYEYRGLSRTAFLQRDYRRGTVDVTLGIAGESMEKVEHDCIMYIDITASEGDTP